MLEKEVKALRFIENYTTITGRCPSIREVGTHMGYSSSSTASTYIKRLRKYGYIMDYTHSPRSLIITDMGKRLIEKERTPFYYLTGKEGFLELLDSYIANEVLVGGVETNDNLRDMADKFIYNRVPVCYYKCGIPSWDQLQNEVVDYIKEKIKTQIY
jgi:SOS-response transcriptional repressor LexA